MNSALNNNSSNKIYYYDDFLGQASFAEKLNKNEDQRLLDFIDTIRKRNKSKLILTTREYILNQAKRTYGKIENSNIDYDVYVIDLSKYTRSIRAKILFNHLYFSELPWEYKENLLNQKAYTKIVDHKNYSPRIIKFMTDPIRVGSIGPDKYCDHFFESLNNPLAIWQHAFESQLSTASRNLLICLLTLPRDVEIDELKIAFHEYHLKKSQKYSQQTQEGDFRSALKELTGNFIINDHSRIGFHNPSIRDYLQNHLISYQSSEIPILIQSAIYFDQLVWLWNFKTKDSKNLRNELKKNKELFFNQTEKVFDTITNRKYQNWLLEFEFTKKELSWSLEARSTILISLTHGMKFKKLESYFQSRIPDILKNITEKKVSEKELIELLREMQKSIGRIYPNYKILIESVKNYLLSNIDDIENYKHIESLYKIVPEIFSKTEIESFENKLAAAIKSVATTTQENEFDAPTVRRIMQTLEWVSGSFGIDAENYIAELEDFISTLEENFDDSNDDYYDSDNPDSDCTDRELDSMFETMG